MNYELAKKLKEAGFPKQLTKGLYFPNDVYLPTLSELIEACGEGFHNLEKFKIKWMANGCKYPDENNTYLVEGSTPEEAVANLWLVLNKEK